MMCGHHWRKAAIAARVEPIFAEVHDSTKEEWIKMMSLDNFQFDVALNIGIGLAFTEQERRAACIQLLLLPKCLWRTNVFLASLWKVDLHITTQAFLYSSLVVLSGIWIFHQVR